MARLTKNWLVNDIIVYHIEEYGKKYLSGRMLDIGCGIKPYKDLLKDHVKEHVGLDHKDSFHDQSNVDLFGTAYDIPQENGTFDSALCSFVLEHLEEPGIAIRECARVLKPGGHALYALPFFWHLHEEPRDFYRYTKHGLKYLFEKNGFEVVELIPMSGFIVTFSQLLTYYLYAILSKNRVLRWIRYILGNVIQRIAKFLNKYDHSHSWSWAYMIVAKKI